MYFFPLLSQEQGERLDIDGSRVRRRTSFEFTQIPSSAEDVGIESPAVTAMNRPFYAACMASYYVVSGDSVVEGPFETRDEARKRKADLSTSDVGVTYRVERR